MTREFLTDLVAENRIDNIRIIQTNDPVIGGQPNDNENEFNSNISARDLACTQLYALEEIEKLKEIKVLDTFGDSKIEPGSQRTINEAKKKADTAYDKATAAQIKADQVPNPIKDQFVVGQDSSKYALKTVAQVRDLIGINDDIPVGVIVEWDHEEAPKKWLFVRNQKFSDVEYPELAKLYPSLILTDRRGVVSRGLDAGRGLDPGRVLGSYQEDATQKVVGNFAMSGFDPSIAVNPTGPFSISQIGGTGATGATYAAYRATFDNSKSNRTANEDRMKNISTNFIIKAK